MEKWIDDVLDFYLKSASDQIFVINIVLALVLVAVGVLMIRKEILNRFFVGRMFLLLGLIGLIFNLIQRGMQG